MAMRAVCATVVTALVAVSLYGCGGDTTTTSQPPAPAPSPVPTPNMTIVELAQATPTLSKLVDLLIARNLTDTLSGEGPFTVFAPTNAAFAAIQSVIDGLTDDQITDVLLYHVVAGDAKAADLSQGQSLQPLFADHVLTVQTITPNVTIHPDGSGAANATVTSPDNLASNGVVHIVDAVLVPALDGPAPAPSPTPLPTIVALAQATPTLSTLVNLLIARNLTDTLSGAGPFTVFAPTDDAFAAAQSVIDGLTDEQITKVLLYHVVAADAKAADLSQGQSLQSLFTDHALTVQTITPNVTIHPDGSGAANATVTSPDNLASNGVVHIVDAVLVPALDSPAPAPAPAPAPLPTIVALAQATPTLSTLVSLLIARNLTDTLNGAGPFTVFAPTDDAFAAIQSVIDGLTDEQITNVLLYHVVAADAKAADLSQGQSLQPLFADHVLTVQTIAPDVTIHPDGSDAADAKVIAADNLASNGVVHIVDTVLVPALGTFNLLVV